MLKNSLELLFENKLNIEDNTNIVNSDVFDLKVRESFKNIKNSFELMFVLNNIDSRIKHYKG